MRAWQPILTPRTVLPTLFIIGILFAPIGGLLIWGSNKVRASASLPLLSSSDACHAQVTEFTLDYTNCDEQSETLSNMPNNKFNCASATQACLSPPLGHLIELLPSLADKLASGHGNHDLPVPQWSHRTNDNGAVGQRSICTIDFTVPYDLRQS